MAEAIDFEGRNIVFIKPEGMTDEECGSLLAFTDGQQVISCWKLSEEELEEVKKTGVIWLSVWGQQPPVYLSSLSMLTSSDPDKYLGFKTETSDGVEHDCEYEFSEGISCENCIFGSHNGTQDPRIDPDAEEEE